MTGKENLCLADRIIDASAEAIMVTDDRNLIVRINPAFTRITGYTAEEAIGKSPSLLSSGKQSARFYEDMWFALKHRGYWQGEIWNKRKSGEIYAEWVSINILRDESNRITNHVAFFSDITLQKESHAQMRRLAHFDSLTGLGNRLLMRDRLSQAMSAAKKANRRVAVLFIDLDRFKQVNDQYGHHVGDSLLIAVADRMKLVLRAEDTIFRQGGDEFVAILTNIANARGIAFAARRLVRELSRPYALSNQVVEIGASVGISIYPDDGITIERLLETADAAMYQAKAGGRGRFFTSQSSQSILSAG